MIVYLPSKELLFKMMRACFGCQTKDDLWINFYSKEGLCEHDAVLDGAAEEKNH